MRKVFGIIFLLATIACGIVGYMLGGPAWADTFHLSKFMSQGGVVVALGGLVCLVLALNLLLGKKKAANAPAG